jgi:hypothetical protein
MQLWPMFALLTAVFPTLACAHTEQLYRKVTKTLEYGHKNELEGPHPTFSLGINTNSLAFSAR